ncbi:MAG TPA: allantoinase AllB [Chthoniobacterales bacterium]
MPDFDLIIHGASPFPFVGIADGKFSLVSKEGTGSAAEEIDATGLEILPGIIDAHIHFNEPGRADWEGIETGSRAAAAGGITTYFDMPLNSLPPTLNAQALQEKRKLAELKSIVDFALWGALLPGNLDELAGLKENGAIGLKAFMSYSGLADFPNVDLPALREGMRRAAELDMLVAVHAEIDQPQLKHGTSIRDYLNSRPVWAELEAIRAAIEISFETGCRLHIVHVSCGEGVAAIAEARARGADVSCETCPHYLVFTEEDVERIGAAAKCAPPIRKRAERDDLWGRLVAGEVQTIGSDHSPAPPSMKQNTDFFKVWGGIMGCQHMLPLMMDLGLSVAQLSELMSKNVAERFRIADRKGSITAGLDADCVLVDREKALTIASDSLFYRHRHSPYVGKTVRGTVERTIVRGQAVLSDRRFSPSHRGKLITPTL